MVEVRPKVISTVEQQFHEQGVVVLRGYIPQKLVREWPCVLDCVRRSLKAEKSLQRSGRFVTGYLPEELFYMHSRFFGDAARVFLTTSNVALYFSRLLMKDTEFSGAVEIHQDMPYFSGGQKKLSAFVPLAPMRADDGGLCFVKGSHKYGMLERGVIQEDKFSPMEHLRPDLEPGDVIFMDFLTWHYSGPCSSERPLMQITFQPATDGSYCDLPGPTLVSGEWRTKYFVKKGECVKPDA